MKRTGFTLVEVLIVAAMIGIIIAAIIELLLKYDVLFATQQATIAVDTSANEIVSRVHLAALQADAIVASHTFGSVALSTGTSTLVLELPSIDSSGAIIGGSRDYVGFYASGTATYALVDAAVGSNRQSGTQQLSDTLLSLSFSYSTTALASATSTTVDVVTQTTSYQTTLTRHLQEQNFLRNL